MALSKTLKLDVKPMAAHRRKDFGDVHCDAKESGWCQCTAWWVPSWDGWKERTAEQNLRLREQLHEGGEYDGYLLYSDGRPIGWIQVGRRDRLEKLVQQFKLEPDPDTWAITCFYIQPDYRGKGMASFLLRQVLANLKRKKVKRVEVFPKRNPQDIHDMWNGPESMFARAGFTVALDDAERPVLAISLE